MVSTHLKHISQIGSFPQNRDENNKSLSCHHVATIWNSTRTQPNRASLILERTPFTSANGTGMIRFTTTTFGTGRNDLPRKLETWKSTPFSRHPFGLLPNLQEITYFDTFRGEIFRGKFYKGVLPQVFTSFPIFGKKRSVKTTGKTGPGRIKGFFGTQPWLIYTLKVLHHDTLNTPQKMDCWFLNVSNRLQTKSYFGVVYLKNFGGGY